MRHISFDLEAVLFAVVVAAAAASFGLSSYFFHKMIREVNEADGSPSSYWTRFRSGGLYLMIRHEQVCPRDESTRYLYFVLGLVGFGLAIWAVTLWNG
jgi:hypothetical protein